MRKKLPSACLATMSLLAATTIVAQDSFYWHRGERIQLRQSLDYVAVSCLDADCEAFEASYSERMPEGLGTPIILQPYGIALMPMDRESTGSPDFEGMSGMRTETPVYDAPGALMLLSGKFIVQLRESILATGQEPQSFLENVLLGAGEGNVEEHARISLRYIVEFPPDVPLDAALTRINAFTANDFVESAQPNFIRVTMHGTDNIGDPIGSTSHGDDEDMRAAGTIEIRPVALAGFGGLSGTLFNPECITSMPNDSLYANQWALESSSDIDIDASDAWARTTGSSDVVIAILDSGVDTSHQEFQGKIFDTYDAIDKDNNQEPEAVDYHGTAVAGIASAASDNCEGIAGVSWESKIFPVRVFYTKQLDTGYYEPVFNDLMVADGIYKAVDRDADILNNSWAGGLPSDEINLAIEYAIKTHNRVVIVSAGNLSSLGPAYPGSLVMDPTADPIVRSALISVSATNQLDQMYWSSNFGPGITIAAPGAAIYTTDNKGSSGYWNGDYLYNFAETSAAAPFVSGAAALLLAEHPGAAPAKIREWLVRGAEDVGLNGHGRLNVYGALKAADLFITLEIAEDDSRFIGPGDQTVVRALVTRGGVASAHERVSFELTLEALSLMSIEPQIALTDDRGVAEATILGESRIPFPVWVRASIENLEDSVTVYSTPY